MFNAEVNSILDLLKAFPDEQSCVDHLEKLRWDGNPLSPFDAESKVYNCKGNRYKCKNTGKYFNVKTNTLFDNTKMPLQKWFLAIWIVTSHKKGISSLQLGRDLDITQKSAWFMLQRIRNCFGLHNDEQLENKVEVDEAYIGGKIKNRHADKKVNYSEGGVDKTPIVGMVERGGKVKAKAIKDTTMITLTREVINSVKKGATIYSYEYTSYNALRRVYDHSVVKHNAKQYVNGRIHTNTIEGFWSIFKIGIFGIYHFTSKKHLQMYVDEFVFRYNTRQGSESDSFNLLLGNTERRLTYNHLIHG